MEIEKDICEHCECNVGIWTVNPYDDDIRGEENWQYICFACYEDLLADI